MPVFRLRFFRGGAEERVSRFLSAHQHKLGIHVFLLSREILDTKRKTFVNENMIIEDVNATTALRSSGGPCAQSGGQAKEGSFRMKLLFSVQACTG